MPLDHEFIIHLIQGGFIFTPEDHMNPRLNDHAPAFKDLCDKRTQLFLFLHRLFTHIPHRRCPLDKRECFLEF